ncbi:hypothetical protein [Alicyclobacillus vulcanalis]|uniref:S-layer homology domain-containing protein n=1 Tax=Alicyclobacillus vulcanalis TaxID=252246 RepID=A0A1N7P351_9BACL|nr:hypothetical protein [Alicyclobacillus vulcanalis]SIT05004.1 hypothetical protein SAMN05421799_11118 [Alicyclobacillus vulcanalis]
MAVRRAWLLAPLCASSLVVPASVQAGLAQGHGSFSTVRVSVGTSSSLSVPALIQGNETYIPLWDLMQVLHQLGFTATWAKGQFSVSAPPSVPMDEAPGPAGKGGALVVLDGQVVEQVPTVIATPPGAATPEVFLPLTNAEEILGRLGIQASATGNQVNLDASAVPQALPNQQVAVWNVLAAVASDLGVSTAPAGPSPYADLPTASPAWGAVEAAIRLGWYSPLSASSSGAFQPITWAQTASILWNALGISQQDAAYQPGGSPTAWASALGLVPENWDPASYMTAQELDTLASNLHECLQGDVETGANTWRLWYPPADEVEATLQSGGGQSLFTSTADAQAAISSAYQFFNQLVVTRVGQGYVVTVPSVPEGYGFATFSALGGVAYQTTPGGPWTVVPVLDTRDVSIPAKGRLSVKVPAQGITITWNQMMPSLGGTVAMGALQVSPGPSGPSVERLNIVTPNLPPVLPSSVTSTQPQS